MRAEHLDQIRKAFDDRVEWLAGWLKIIGWNQGLHLVQQECELMFDVCMELGIQMHATHLNRMVEVYRDMVE